MTTNKLATLTDISRYVYGTTRLGDSSIAFSDRVAIARTAYQTSGWIHTSHQYGDALKVLRAAFDEDRSSVPSVIAKIGWSSAAEVRSQIVDQNEALGIPSMAIGQLCAGGDLADDLGTGGPSVEGLHQLKAEGIVGRFVLEVFPWTSHVALNAIRGGHVDDLIDGYIFYLNPLQRFANNELWDLLLERGLSIIAMRTVAGGNVHSLANNERAPAYMRQRAAEVAPLFDRSGVPTWSEFAARYSLGFPLVRATVGSTSRLENLQELFAATTKGPLPEDIVQEILALQRRWSEEVDVLAEPWTM